MLTSFDDYPVHQTALPIAHAGGGHPDYYDRFWFNGYTEDYYFAVALGLYPNRGVIEAEPLEEARHHVDWAPGLRRSQGAALTFSRAGEPQTVLLEPVLTLRMRGAGAMHPTWGHGRWHDELAVAGEQHRVEELDTLDPTCIHVQQVVRATWGERAGLGVLEQLAIGPHAPSGFRELFDGAAT